MNENPHEPIPTLQDAAEAIRRGLAVAFSTDTVWGLGARHTDEAAVERIYTLKRRPAEKSLQVLCADFGTARSLLALDATTEARFLKLATLWPGALTLVLPAAASCPTWLTRDGKVGLRVPASDSAQAFLRACGGTLAATSLNPSGDPPAHTYRDALALGLADLVLPGEDAAGQASTVYDVSMGRILREGALPASVIAELVD